MMKRRSAAISPKKKATLPEAGRKLSPRIAASVGFAAVLFFFWWLSCPHILSFHEQNQLFLFDWKYLAGRLSVSGGLADWCSEFIVQFFCYPALGAFMMALLFSLLQWALSRLFANYALSFVVPLLVLVWMGDVDALVSFPVALAGAGGGRLASVCDVVLAVPATRASHVQEMHIAVGHMICGLVERAANG